MGFMDKMKGTAKQAMSPRAQMGERDKIMKINQSGIEARATVDSMQETARSSAAATRSTSSSPCTRPTAAATTR